MISAAALLRLGPRSIFQLVGERQPTLAQLGHRVLHLPCYQLTLGPTREEAREQSAAILATFQPRSVRKLQLIIDHRELLNGIKENLLNPSPRQYRVTTLAEEAALYWKEYQKILGQSAAALQPQQELQARHARKRGDE